MNEIDRIKKQNKWLRDLSNYEDVALKMLKPFDLMTCEPEVIICHDDMTWGLCDYFRAMISSEPQQASFAGGGRQMAAMVIDRSTGAFMGIVAVSDLRTAWRIVMQHFEWNDNPDLKQDHQHQILMLRRCLPLAEFGAMTGGKLLALLVTSREVIRLLELKYSYQFCYFGIFTLHSRTSQYNRLQQRGIEYVGADDRGRGFYGMELRKKGVDHMRGKGQYGKPATYSFSDQVTYWKERWLAVRMQSTGNTSIVTPDPERYRLTAHMDDKRLTTLSLLKEEPNGEDVENQED